MTRLTTPELCKALGVSPMTVTNWVKRGLPHKGGRGSRTFDRAEVEKWRTVNVGRKARGSGKRNDLIERRPVEVMDAPQLPAVIGDDSLRALLDRCRQREMALCERMQQATDEGELAAIEITGRNWVAVVKERRQLEEKYAKIQLDQGRVTPNDVVEQQLIRFVSILTAQLQLIGGAVAPRCEGQGQVQIKAIIDEAVRDARSGAVREIRQWIREDEK